MNENNNNNHKSTRKSITTTIFKFVRCIPGSSVFIPFVQIVHYIYKNTRKIETIIKYASTVF